MIRTPKLLKRDHLFLSFPTIFRIEKKWLPKKIDYQHFQKKLRASEVEHFWIRKNSDQNKIQNG